ncbi:SusC/RagA family TonB-linked outer membrane protein [Rubrivirga sp. S365]|uniref:SusC/RagA family TonB-linked outer membrane protein n=1 Tax=Rubrivirga sp. S365 TaxID=3076080 RepID=UPI0028C7941A|nr:SusC/RagA family TonB-linked outer membrane protein [Rubrivirga sp. S365]MDT7857273.1 SusC/RagA family TonB-linked outer membrane protein [Rubrivirga sp. S365]
MRLAFLVGLVTCAAGPALAQSAYTITGRVVDAALEDGVPGASVLLDGTQAGAATDVEGRFSFDARVEPGTYTLRASFVGFTTVETPVTLGAAPTVDVGVIELADDALRSDEVIVSATGLPIERRQLGNAIGTIDAREIADAGATSVDQAIVGKVAGAVVSQNSGNPAGGISIRLRGPSTVLGSADPLYVIDGVIIDNTSAGLIDLGGGDQNRLVDLNPEDIERIEILKGASAAALYGSRANGGVVQIFTKRGQTGAPSVTLSTSVRTDAIRKTLDVNRAAFDRPQGTAPEASLSPQPTQRFDYQDDIFHQAVGTEQYLSVSGGQGGGTYFFSGGHFFNEGIVRGNQFRRLNGRVRVGQDFGDLLNLSIGANYTRSRSQDIPNGGLNSAYGALTAFIFGPNFIDIQPDPVTGEYPVTSPGVPVDAAGDPIELVQQNPLDVVNNFDFSQTTNRFTGDAQAQLTPAEGLSISYVLGLDTYSQSGLALIPRGSTAGGFDGGYSRRADFNVTNLNNDLRLQYQTQLGESLESTTTLGGTSQYDQNSTFAIQTFDLNVGVETVDGGSRPSAVGESRSESTLLGAFVQQTFGVYDQLFVTAAGRVDASSRFGPDNRTNFYPKVSASYDAGSNDAYARAAQNGYFPSTLRLRASYGESGGLTSIGPFTRFTRYGPGAYAGSNGLLPPGLLGNPGVEPERQSEFEVGTDLGFFDDRLGIEATYYTQNTTDLLLNVELPLTSGFSNQLQNVGELSNKGFELLLRALPVETEGFRWSSTATFATNKNRIDLDPSVTADPFDDVPDETLILGNSFGLVAVIDDQPQGVFYGSGFARDDAGNIVGLAVNPATNQIVLDAQNLPTFTTGTIGDDGLLRDAGGAVIVPVRDGTQRIIGDPNPDFTASWINEFDVGRRFSARVQLDGAFGGDIFNFTRRLAALRNFGTLSDYQAEIEGRVPVGYYQNSGVPGPDPRNYGTFSIFENWIEDGTFVKLREVSLTYLVPVDLFRGMGVQGLRVTAYGRNLLSFDSYSGYDPETNVAGQSTGVRGYDFVEVPIPRTFGLTLQATL